MNLEIANVVTQRLQSQMGAMMLQIIQLQAEKEAAEKALAEAQKPAESEAPK